MRVVAIAPTEHERRHRSLGDALRSDVGRAIAMATGGVLVFAPVEYALTLWTYAGDSSPAAGCSRISCVRNTAFARSEFSRL